MSIKVCLYSITYLGVWYRGGSLTWKEVLRRAKDFGFDGVEFDAKRPHANPMDWDERTRREIVWATTDIWRSSSATRPR